MQDMFKQILLVSTFVGKEFRRMKLFKNTQPSHIDVQTYTQI